MSERTKPDDLLNPREAAEILRVTDRTVLRYIEAGHLAAVQLPGGRLWRIRRADVEALLTTEASV
jgi:excisionase family DNA binding protein